MSRPDEPDCRRLGLRCADCLPPSRWCDLCTAATGRTHEVQQVEVRNRDWGYDTLDVAA